MKKIITVLALSFIGLNSIYAQYGMKNALKVTPITILKGQAIMLHYERQLTNKMTVGIGVAPIVTAPVLGSLAYPSDRFKVGFAMDPEIRWYAKSDIVMDGFFVGLYNSNRFSSWESSTESILNYSINFNPIYTGSQRGKINVSDRKTIIGLQLGTHRLIGEHFSVDFYSGFGFSSRKTTAKFSSNDVLYDKFEAIGANLRLNLALGWVF